MKLSKRYYLSTAAAIGALALAALPLRAVAQEVAIDSDDIGGVVTGPNGPEAGVWVIAETTDLPTRFARIVVTDDRGRYVVPDLPKGKYNVWVRGYGLVDSAKVVTEPGKHLDLKAVVAPDAAAAAQYYPAIYWYSMMKIPDKNQFGPNGSMPQGVTQQEYLVTLKNRACVGCHQLGQLATRTIPAALGTIQVGRGSLDAPHPVGPSGGADDQSALGPARRRALQVSRRLDRPRCPRRTAACQAASARRASSATSW